MHSAKMKTVSYLTTQKQGLLGVKSDNRKIIESEVKRKKNCDNPGISGNYSNILLE
jgi:hypothetical protein